MKSEQKIKELVAKVEDHYKADALVYCGPLARPWDDFFIDLCAKGCKRPNVLLMLTTTGGDAHVAYRIARCLQKNYNRAKAGIQTGKVLIYVNGVCASAGTLITLASDKLILSDHTELGPLDVQIRKPDEVGERVSGLTPIQALTFLESETKKFFKSQFENLRFSRDLSFSTKLAADIATQLATGLLAKLYEQIDPLRLAEYDRANRIGEHYGERIKTSNVKDHTVGHLLRCYPSHEICIDMEEAQELFNVVELPTPELEELGNLLKPFAEKYVWEDEPAMFFLADQGETKTEPSSNETPKNNEPKRGRRAESGSGQANGGQQRTARS